MSDIRAFAFGGGVQSTAVLVLSAQGKLPYTTFLFAEVGDDSENPATIAYIRDITEPFAKEHGLDFVRVVRHNRNAPGETLLGWTMRSERSVRIPAYMAGGAPGRRSCTGDFKILPILRWLKAHGATKAVPMPLGLGISTDEFQRAKSPTDPRSPEQLREYPLIELNMNRNDCLWVVSDAGLPQPPKSSCWFCPFHTRRTWQDMKRTTPELFQQAVELEQALNLKRDNIGRDHVFLHTSKRPLDKAVGDQGHFDDLMDACEEGYCGV